MERMGLLILLLSTISEFISLFRPPPSSFFSPLGFSFDLPSLQMIIHIHLVITSNEALYTIDGMCQSVV